MPDHHGTLEEGGRSSAVSLSLTSPAKIGPLADRRMKSELDEIFMLKLCINFVAPVGGDRTYAHHLRCSLNRFRF